MPFDLLDLLYLGSMRAATAANSKVDHPKIIRDLNSRPDCVPDEPKASWISPHTERGSCGERSGESKRNIPTNYLTRTQD